MREKLKKLFSYYKPYRVLFYSDMFFAILGAVITLVIPLIVRYITVICFLRFWEQLSR